MLSQNGATKDDVLKSPNKHLPIIGATVARMRHVCHGLKHVLEWLVPS